MPQDKAPRPFSPGEIARMDRLLAEVGDLLDEQLLILQRLTTRRGREQTLADLAAYYTQDSCSKDRLAALLIAALVRLDRNEQETAPCHRTRH